MNQRVKSESAIKRLNHLMDNGMTIFIGISTPKTMIFADDPLLSNITKLKPKLFMLPMATSRPAMFSRSM